MKRIRISFILLALSFGIVYSQKSSINLMPKEEVQGINILAVDFSLMTPVAINCSLFKESFDCIKQAHIVDQKRITSLFQFLEDLDETDENYSDVIDTRAVLSIFSDSDTISICVGSLVLNICEEKFKTPEELLELIDEITNDE